MMEQRSTRPSPTRRFLWLVAIAILAVATVAEARFVPDARLSRLTKAAEAAGDAYERPDGGSIPQAIPFQYSGRSDRRCVRTGSASAVRSGEFVAGPFDFRGGSPLKKYLWWTPVYPRFRDSLLVKGAVTATRLNAFNARVTLDLDRNGRVGSGNFYPSNFSPRWFGTWMIVVTAGPNWGCFIYTV